MDDRNHRVLNARNRLHRLERDPHRGNVLRRRPAAAADDPRPVGHGLCDDATEILRPGGVDEATLDPARQPGIGHDRERVAQPCPSGFGRRHPVNRVEAGKRPRPAIHPDRVGAGLNQRPDCPAGSRPVGSDQLLAEGHLRDDRQIGRPPRLVERENQVLERPERLEHEQVDAALEQSVDLLAEGRPNRAFLVLRQLAPGRSERPDRTGHEGIAARDVARLPGDLRRPPIERVGAIRKSVCIEPVAIRAERGRLDELCAGIQVFTVDRSDEVRPRRGQLIQARSLRNPAREQQRAHRAVGEDRPAGKPVTETLSRSHAGRLPETAAMPAARNRLAFDRP